MRFMGDKKGNNRLLTVLCFAAALALLISSFGATLAKFIRKDQGKGTAVAAPFYFTSDRLQEDRPYYQIDEPVSGGKVQIVFHLSNYVDRLRCTDKVINYTYRAVSGDDLTAASIAGTEGSGRLEAGEFRTSADIVIELDQSDFSSGVVTIEAKASTPYEKTISAQFGFTAQQHELQPAVGDNKGKIAVVLELAGGNGGQVRVAWPDTLYPDLSNRIFDGAAAGEVTFTAQPGVRYAMTFFKTNINDEFTEADFSVTAL